ncbi:unnamed protein product, partial [Closterium sp. NIES-65]
MPSPSSRALSPSRPSLKPVVAVPARALVAAALLLLVLQVHVDPTFLAACAYTVPNRPRHSGGAAAATRAGRGRLVRSPLHSSKSAAVVTTGLVGTTTVAKLAVKTPAAAGGCSASSIAGYTSSVALSGS